MRSEEIDSESKSVFDQMEKDSTIVTSTIFKLKAPGEYSEKYSYSRYGNPTRDALEKSLASLDRADFAFTYSSKVAASLAVLSSLKAEDLVIFNNVLNCEKFRKLSCVPIETKKGEFEDLKSFESSLNFDTKIVWIESPSDPLLTILNLKAIADIVHAKSKALLVVDNTLLTPRFQRPLELGADVVIYSVGEFIGGHDDVMMGAVVTSNKMLSEKLKYNQYSTGAVPSPFDCYNVTRSLKTFALRMEQHSKNSCAVAQFLDRHSKVEKVFHPSLKTYANYKISSAQSVGYSGIVSFYIKGSLEHSQKFFKSLKIIVVSESLGGCESSASFPWLMSYSEVSEKVRLELGVTENLIRISVGLEDVDKIIADINQALELIPEKKN